MDDVTDSVFRRVVGDLAAPDLYFTEFVNVDGLQSPGRPKLLKKIQFTDAETPLIAQIWGLSPENFAKTAKELKDGTLADEANEQKGLKFAGVDLNFGCPVKTVIKNGACSAMIDDKERASEIIEAIKKAVGDDFPISVKTRLGVREFDEEWFKMLLGKKLNMLTIHGRTQKEMSKVPAHWDDIERVRRLRDEISPSTLIVGNGDVLSKKQGLELVRKHGLDGIMIGRGVFHDPYVFADDSPWEKMTQTERIDLYKKHIQLFADTWKLSKENDEDQIKTIRPLNKFCKMYINGFDGASELRDKLMHAKNIKQLLGLL